MQYKVAVSKRENDLRARYQITRILEVAEIIMQKCFIQDFDETVKHANNFSLKQYSQINSHS